MNDLELHDNIDDAAEGLKEAMESMGCKNVVVLYGYEHGDYTYTGKISDSRFLTLGVLQQIDLQEKKQIKDLDN